MSTLHSRLDDLNKQMNRVLEASDKTLHGPKIKTEPISEVESKRKIPPAFWKLERKQY